MNSDLEVELGFEASVGVPGFEQEIGMEDEDGLINWRHDCVRRDETKVMARTAKSPVAGGEGFRR